MISPEASGSITAIGTLLSATAVMLYVPFIIRQAQAANLTLNAVAKGLRQTAAHSVRTHFVELNQLLLENEELRELFDLETREVLAVMLLNDFENLFTQYAEDLVDSEFWDSKVNIIRKTVNLPWVRDVWKSEHRDGFQKTFIEFIDSLLIEQPSDVPTEPALSQGSRSDGRI
jgi:hypothetical protein